MTKSNLTAILTLTAVNSLILAFSPHRFISGIYDSELDTLSRMKMSFDKQVSDVALAELQHVTFPNAFHAVEGVTTFRGGPYRDKPSHGVLSDRPKTLTIKWSFAT